VYQRVAKHQQGENVMQVQPYLNFDGRCEEAIEFYKTSLGATVDMVMRMKECPDAMPGKDSPEMANKILHSAFHIGDTQVMASDGRCMGNAKFDGIMLSISAKDPGEAEKIFKALSDGGMVQMPLAKTFFSPSFGMLADRFGVNWMVIAAE
jgi:PhnB protein